MTKHNKMLTGLEEVKTNVVEYPKDDGIIKALNDMLKHANKGEIVCFGFAAVMKNRDIKTYHNSENDIFGLLGALEVVKARAIKDNVDLG